MEVLDLVAARGSGLSGGTDGVRGKWLERNERLGGGLGRRWAPTDLVVLPDLVALPVALPDLVVPT